MQFEKKLGDAYASCKADELTVGNDVFERSWRLTQDGPVSLTFINKLTDARVDIDSDRSDWQLPDGSEPAAGRLAGASAETVPADGLTSEQLRVGCRWEFPGKGLSIRWDIGVYPGAPGMRTRLFALGAAGTPKGGRDQTVSTAGTAGKPVEARSAFMPLVGTRQTAFGYYNDTQNRNKDVTDILREEPAAPEEQPYWASVFLNHVGDGGWMAVKESHKCPNQDGYDTGRFLKIGSAGNWTGLATTGWGLQPDDILFWKLRGGWANWFVVWGGKMEAAEALKRFDRARYPFDEERDVYVMSNTWGSNRSREAADFESVKQDIDVAADIGVDVVQIDDGWQTGVGENTWSGPVRWQPDDEKRFPGGWDAIRTHYREQGVTPGLWSAWVIPDEELIENMRAGGFRCFKIDFAILNSYDKIEMLYEKARHLIDASGATVRINWDVTENPPRVGYFWGREFGNIYLENRKPDFPQRVVYVPRLVLRDAWQLSRWLPLNKFQITCQNVDMVDPAFSDAPEHPHDYCLAITLMGSPIFFQELKYLSAEAKDALRPLLKAYRAVRREILTGLVTPIGAKPSGASFTGFQCETAEGKGYLTLFREKDCAESAGTVKLRKLPAGTLELTDLMTGAVENAVLEDGRLSLAIENAPGYRFFRYRRK